MGGERRREKKEREKRKETLITFAPTIFVLFLFPFFPFLLFSAKSSDLSSVGGASAEIQYNEGGGRGSRERSSQVDYMEMKQTKKLLHAMP